MKTPTPSARSSSRRASRRGWQQLGARERVRALRRLQQQQQQQRVIGTVGGAGGVKAKVVVVGEDASSAAGDALDGNGIMGGADGFEVAPTAYPLSSPLFFGVASAPTKRSAATPLAAVPTAAYPSLLRGLQHITACDGRAPCAEGRLCAATRRLSARVRRHVSGCARGPAGGCGFCLHWARVARDHSQSCAGAQAGAGAVPLCSSCS